MALQVGHVLTCFRVPYLDIIFHETSREKYCWILRIKANSSNNCFVANKLELHHVFWLFNQVFSVIVFHLFKVWCDQDLDHLVVRACGDESTCLTPIDTVNGTIMMLLLLKDHFDTLVLLMKVRLAGIASVLVYHIAKWFQN